MKVEMDGGPAAKQSPASPTRPDSSGMKFVRRALVLLLMLGAVGAVVVSGILPRVKAKKELELETKDRATRRVSVIHPKSAPASQEVVLPANILAFTEAPIYARTNGYLKSWLVDIGANVKAGQLLAEIDTPEINQQIEQAKADLDTSEANFRLAQITANRYQELMKTNSVAQQDADNATGNFDARRAAVESARYNLKRLQEMQSFSKIYAPFDGVITARNTDIGALIDSGSGGTARELFHIVYTKKLRVYVDVPQIYSAAAKPGIQASITLAGFPGRGFSGALVRTANAIDPASRTLRAEIDVDNTNGAILPGSYGEVHLKMPSQATTFTLPINTLLFRSEGLQIGIVGSGGRITLQHITLGRDFGTEVEVVSGLTGDESVVVNPPDSLFAGETVEISQPSAKEAKK